MAHQLPPFPQGMRFARPADIERLAIIAFAGGLQTDEFRYERPYAHKYPEDTLNAWRHYLAASLRSERDAIIVVEDMAHPDEDELTPDIVPVRYGTLGVGRCVVGFARLKLRPTYPNERKFQRFLIRNWTSEGMKRDQHSDRAFECSLRVALESKHLIETNLTLETLTVHPAYHRRGHGRSLVNWIKELARMDNAAIGIVATRLGIPLYRSLNFEKVHSFEVAAGVPFQLMKYDPVLEGKKQSNEDHPGNATHLSAIDEYLKEVCHNLSSLSLS